MQNSHWFSKCVYDEDEFGSNHYSLTATVLCGYSAHSVSVHTNWKSSEPLTDNLSVKKKI